MLNIIIDIMSLPEALVAVPPASAPHRFSLIIIGAEQEK